MPYYELPPRRPAAPGDGGTALGLAVGGLGTLLLAFAMVPLRDHIPNADVALALVVPVALGAVIGGRTAGILSAAVAALSFNFVYTKPYLSLRIASSDDIVTFIMLAIIGVVAAELGAYARHTRLDARRTRSELERTYRIAALSAQGADVDDVVASVRAEMIGLFGLDDCVYEPAPVRQEAAVLMPRLGHRGTLEEARLVAVNDFLLPTGGVEVPVSGRGHTFGRLVLYAPDATPAPLDKRLAAVTMAAELGATLASRTPV